MKLINSMIASYRASRLLAKLEHLKEQGAIHRYLVYEDGHYLSCSVYPSYSKSYAFPRRNIIKAKDFDDLVAEIIYKISLTKREIKGSWIKLP